MGDMARLAPSDDSLAAAAALLIAAELAGDRHEAARLRDCAGAIAWLVARRDRGELRNGALGEAVIFGSLASG